ncbi:MAG: MerR family transcriptional regulator [Limisphaerales bacterium]
MRDNSARMENIIGTVLDVEMEIYEPCDKSTYLIEEVARILNTTRRSIALYCRYGLISPQIDPQNNVWFFDEEAILRLKRIEYLRNTYNLNLQAVKIIIELMNEVERLRQELRRLQMK